VKPDHLVMHLNCPSYFCQETHFGQWVDAAAEFWKPFLEKLGQGGVHTVFENVMEPDPVAAVAFLEALEKYNVGFCLDIGHAHAFTDHEPVLWVEEMGERITHFHIHDNSGEDDEHMAPGRGSIDFDKLYSLIQQYCPDAVLSIEVDTGVDEVIHGLQTSKYFCDENI
jgi:sugar phosphate isomerase/epimerase